MNAFTPSETKSLITTPRKPAVIEPSDITRATILERLHTIENAHVPTFYECGIIDAGIGYYQLVQLPDAKRMLVFGLNLEDFCLKEFIPAGYLFADPATLYGVNAYGKSASAYDIYADMIQHQADLRRVVREEYTLIRTAKNVFQSRAVSYRINGATEEQAPSIDAFFDSLHSDEFAKIHTDDKTATHHDRMRYPRIPVTTKNDVTHHNAPMHILQHYTRLLKHLASGQNGIQAEDTFLRPYERLLLRSKIYSMHVLDNLRRNFKKTYGEVLEKNPEPVFELAGRLNALLKLRRLIMVHESSIELALTVWDAFKVSNTGVTHSTVPAGLEPYAEPPTFHTRLNTSLHNIAYKAIETAKPLTAKEACIAPMNSAIASGSPFDVDQTRIPDIGALRAPLGTILHVYENSTLMLQANGLWLALCHDARKIYVGYNRDLDTASKPNPSPIMQAWLHDNQLLCYTHTESGFDAKQACLDDVQHDLREILATDKHLIGAHQITESKDVYKTPRRETLRMRFAEALPTIPRPAA